MGDSQSEDMVFLLDTSSSMYRNDNEDNRRIEKGILAIEQIVQKKMEIDPQDRYAAVTFAKETHSMGDMCYTATEIIAHIQKSAEFEHVTALGEALSEGIQLILKQMRFIGQKQSRIIIISDGLAQLTSVNPINVAKIAMQLGIIIDVIRFGQAQIPGNLLKKLAELTGGSYIYVASEIELSDAVERLALKKESQHSTIFDKTESNDVMAQEILAEIADIPLKLEDMTEEQKNQALYKKETDKKLVCTICYVNKCMQDKTSFLGCGRFCPNCLTPFHLHCAIMWSDQQSGNKSNRPSDAAKLFRCPHCFYLLKIPVSNLEKKGSETAYGAEVMLKKISTSSLGTEAHICNVDECGVLISEETDGAVYQCTSCHSVFHLDCGAGAVQKDSRCPYCKKPVTIVD